MNLRHFLRFLLVAVLLLMGLGAAHAQDASGGAFTFEHALTGFPLTGLHSAAQCESCHIQGQFRGTPRDCASCHRSGTSRPVEVTMPMTHIPTTQPCDTCHRTTGWKPATYTHQGVTKGSCTTCHNGATAAGKPANHMATTSSCDACHKQTAWTPAGYDHARVTPGTCATCHGVTAMGKPAGHIPTSAACDTCHTNFLNFAPAQMNHAGMAGQCTTCHSGGFLSQNAQTKPPTHIATTAQCDSCHHSTTSWATAANPHSIVPAVATIGAGGCTTCHGVSALGKPTNHIPTAAQCDTCHKNFTAFKPAIMDHAGTAGLCSNCHNGSFNFANARAKPVTHIPSTAQCDTCHTNVVTFAPARMDHTGTAGKCATCHGGAFLGSNAQTKPATHIPTTASCDTCHTSTSTWATKPNPHSATSAVAVIGGGGCTTCHNGTNALGKPTNHIPTTAQCDTCHTNFSAFSPAAMNHVGMAGKCTTCHNGAYTFANAQPRPPTHIPDNRQCDTCHVQGFVAFAPAAMNHTGLGGLCASCHNGAYLAQNAQTKSATHVATAAQCDTCHRSTTTWATATFDHVVNGVTPGSCVTCHNGVQALGKPTNHIPTAGLASTACDACHNTYTAFTPAAMNHTGTAGMCATCHNGAFNFANALGKPATHLPTTSGCDTCHTTAAWRPASYSHAPTDTNCSSCHNGVTALGKSASHIPTTAQCSTCHTNQVAFNPAVMSHAGTTGPAAAANCATCHGGGFLTANAQAKPPTHIGTTAQCDTCHNSTTTWATSNFNHAAATPAVGGRCATCHNNMPPPAGAIGKPTNHIPTTTQCDSCHTNFTAFSPATMSHPVTAGPAAAGNCATCHNGAYLFTGAQTKSARHIPTTAQCDRCHINGYGAWSPSTMNHTGLAGQCSTCHSGAYLAQNAQAKSPTHVATAAQCDTCHRSTITWSSVVYVHDASAAGTCATCHNGSTALGKPTNHIPTSRQCDSCHKNFSAFAPAAMDHTATAGTCSTCHNGSYAAQNAQFKSATHVATTAQCDTCHRSTVSWSGAAYAHSAGDVVCDSCHRSGGTGLAKPALHIPTTAQCSTCHSNYIAFRPAVMSHSGTAGPIAAGNCATCHSGAYTAVNALAKPVTHVPTVLSCDICHTTTAFRPASFTHSPTDTNCLSCHNGSTALGKNATHIPTTAQCSSCHGNYIAFAPATMSHTATAGPVAAGNCSTCHGGSYLAVNAQTKSATHIGTSAQCDSCHLSTTTWATAAFNHALASPPATGRCSTCHNGSTALGKPTNHIPTTAQCDTCHNNYVAFNPALMNHTGLAGQCSTCHSGSYLFANALAKPVSHIPTTAQCDSCHVNGFTAWSPSTMNHTGLAGQCSTCHSGAYLAQNAQAKSPTHVVTNAQCDTCHNSTVTWANATFSHAPSAVGTCSTCHNGSTALGKPTNHIPTTAQCDTCHRNYSAFAPATMSHSGTAGPVATGNCSTCHSGAYAFAGALAKSATHLPTTAQCDTCHNTTAFRPATYTHAPTDTNCSTCHNGSTALGKNATHIPTTSQCSTCHGNYTAFAPATMNHAAAAGPAAALGLHNCATCHSGSYLAVNAQSKSATHIATTAQCDTCHTSTSTWSTANFNHASASPAVTGRCSTCHNNTNAVGKPGTHIPTTAQCDTCHRNFTAFNPATMSHSGTSGPIAAGNCTTCHNGGYTAMNAQVKPAVHIPTTAQCDTCHTTMVWLPVITPYSHSGIAPGSCSTCHGGAYPNIEVKTASHIPTTAQCDACHRVTAWLPLITPYNHAGVAAGSCSSCHTTPYTSIEVKPAAHIPTTAQCDACHTKTTWLPLTTYSHAGVATGTCATCHYTPYTNITVMPSNHIPLNVSGMPGIACSFCHSSTTSFSVERMNHGTMQTSCITCHDRSSPYLGSMEKITRGSGHHNSAGKDCSSVGCHKPLGSKGRAYSAWD